MVISLTKTHEQFIKEIKNRNNKVTIVGKYTKATDYIKAKCKICGHEWEPIVSSLLRGSSHKESKTIHSLKE